jgi:hypothetical protein
VKAGTCTRGVRVSMPKHRMLAHIPSPPQVRLRSSTTPQGLPRYRLPIMPSQNSSTRVPSTHSHT